VHGLEHPGIVSSLRAVPHETLIDGEIVALDEAGLVLGFHFTKI
jgi:hypothetical protein